MRAVRFGGADMYLCDKCSGLWVDPITLQRLVADRLKPSPLLGTGIAAPPPERISLQHVEYAPCPICKNLMNRVNFAHTSGVIVDVCTPHGTWFDADELRRVLEFVTAGGLEAARARELRQTPSSTTVVQDGSPLVDQYKIVRPILDGKDAKLIIQTLVTFTGRKKMS